MSEPAAKKAKVEEKDDKPKYRLHVYDHCPYCNRVEILLAFFKVPYERVLYGYGDGAIPAESGNHGYGEGPRVLTGKKMMPVLEGPDVPAPKGMKGMPESLDLCSYVISKFSLVVPAKCRDDVDKWAQEGRDTASKLVRPRTIKMPTHDWADERDVQYAKWKYTTKFGFDYAAAEAATPELVAKMNAHLEKFVPLIRGEASLNAWGWGMDDVLLLPHLRQLLMVKGIVFPEKVQKYMDSSFANAKFFDYATAKL